MGQRVETRELVYPNFICLTSHSPDDHSSFLRDFEYTYPCNRELGSSHIHRLEVGPLQAEVTGQENNRPIVAGNGKFIQELSLKSN